MIEGTHSSSHRGRWLAVLVLLIGVAIALAAGSGRNALVGTAAEPEAPEEHAKALSKAFRKAAEAALPTVVTVRTHAEGAARPGRRPDNPFKGSPFEDMFPEDMDQFLDGESQPRDGMGSGVIIDSKGIVLTNNHVVEGADTVIVHLPDGREYEATDIKRDPQTDLAVLTIRSEDSLPAARLGNSDEMEIGDWVIAVGNPFELESTVSAGIISGKGRDLGRQRTRYLQTDAAINPGNSGGPLLNLDGEVVGINTAIATSNGGYQGVGFAIPINLAKWVTGQLIDKGSVQRAYLGVGIAEINAELAQKFDVRRGAGVLVTEVFPNTPASEAGFEVGDVITRFDGKEVRSPRDLQELVERTNLDSRQPLTVMRNGESLTLNVVVKALPNDFGTVAELEEGSEPDEGERPQSSAIEPGDLGLEVKDLSAEDAARLGYEGQSGVLIARVDPRSIAAAGGLREEMLISKVGRKPVRTVAEFDAAMKDETLAKGILLAVRTRSGGNRIVVLRAN